MREIDILGLTLKEGLDAIDTDTIKTVNIRKTVGLNRKFKDNLNEPRIIKVSMREKSVDLVVSYF